MSKDITQYMSLVKANEVGIMIDTASFLCYYIYKERKYFLMLAKDVHTILFWASIAVVVPTDS